MNQGDDEQNIRILPQMPIGQVPVAVSEQPTKQIGGLSQVVQTGQPTNFTWWMS